MTTDALVQVMTAAVVIAAIALLAQAVMIFGIFRSIQSLREQISRFLPRAESFLFTSEKTLEDSR